MTGTSRSLRGGRIFLVDMMESAMPRRMNALEDVGHEVKRIRLTDDAVRVVRDYPPHCIVLRVLSTDDAAVLKFLGEVRRIDHQVEILAVNEELAPVDASALAERYRVVGSEQGVFDFEQLVDKALTTMSDNFADPRTRPATMANYGVKLIASISSALIGVNGRGNVTLWNNTAETTFGIDSSQALGRPLSRLGIRWADAGTMDQIRAAGLVDLPTRLDDVRIYREGNEQRILGMTMNPIHGGTPEDKGMLIMARDLSEIRTIESQLSKAQKLESTWKRALDRARKLDGPVRRLLDDVRSISELSARLAACSGEPSGETASLEELAALAGRTLKDADRIAAGVQSLLELRNSGGGTSD